MRSPHSSRSSQPDVSLALDPAWHMGENEVPGETIGSMTADELNAVSARLSEIVRRRRLPEKMLVVHQFTRDMIDNRDRLRRYPASSSYSTSTASAIAG